MKLILSLTVFCLCLGVGQASSDAVFENANASLLCTADQEMARLQEGVAETQSILSDWGASHQDLGSEQIKTIEERLSALEKKVSEDSSTLHQLIALLMRGGESLS